MLGFKSLPLQVGARLDSAHCPPPCYALPPPPGHGTPPPPTPTSPPRPAELLQPLHHNHHHHGHSTPPPRPSTPLPLDPHPTPALQNFFSRFALDIIGKAVFNYDFDALTHDDPVIQAGGGGLRLVGLPWWHVAALAGAALACGCPGDSGFPRRGAAAPLLGLGPRPCPLCACAAWVALDAWLLLLLRLTLLHQP